MKNLLFISEYNGYITTVKSNGFKKVIKEKEEEVKIKYKNKIYNLKDFNTEKSLNALNNRELEIIREITEEDLRIKLKYILVINKDTIIFIRIGKNKNNNSKVYTLYERKTFIKPLNFNLIDYSSKK